jgi:hypothetical protein
LSPALLLARPAGVSFSPPQAQIDRLDYVEITATVQSPNVRNPFEDASLFETLEAEDGSQTWKVEGFSDSEDGSL